MPDGLYYSRFTEVIPFFSIIVSLYNVEKFFKRGIKCILSQTYTGYEVILIDDGSTDSTPFLCDELVKAESKIKVIHQDNQGLGGARNKGIKNAKGKYLCFFDIDDLVEDDWLENIYEEIKEVSPDLLIYGYKEINIKLKSENSFRFERNLLTDKSHVVKEFVESLSGVKFNNGFAWNKVYRRNFILEHDLRFPNNIIQQDEIFNHHVYQHFPKTLISDKILYNYYIYDKGNNRKRYIPQRIRNFENVKASFLKIKNNFEISDRKFENYIHLRFLTNVLYNRNPINTYKDRKRFYSSITNNNQVIDSIGYLKKNKLKIKNLHDLFFNTYCFGIRKKSLPSLFIVDFLTDALQNVSGFIHKWRNTRL